MFIEVAKSYKSLTWPVFLLVILLVILPVFLPLSMPITLPITLPTILLILAPVSMPVIAPVSVGPTISRAIGTAGISEGRSLTVLHNSWPMRDSPCTYSWCPDIPVPRPAPASSVQSAVKPPYIFVDAFPSLTYILFFLFKVNLLQSFLSLHRVLPCRSHSFVLMLFKSFVKAAMVASALAQPVQQQQHQHHQHEKKAVVTHTVVVTVGAGANAEVTTLPAISLSVASTITVSSQSVVNNVVPSVVPTGTASGTSTYTATSSTSSSTSSFSGAAKAITYSPYASDGSCKSASTVASDLAQLTSFEIIRIYGVDCNQVENVLAALAPGQKLFAGIYYVNAISSGVATLAAAVKNNGGWSRVHTVSIGNELVNGGEATTAQVKAYVDEGRTALTAAGYTGSVVSVDTFIAVINNPALCGYSDYIAVNAHAYFDGYVTAEQAGDWVLLQIERVATVCTGKSVFITETGWPTKGNANGVAVPSTANQKAALASISEKCGNDVTFFTAFNDLWKSDGSYGVEKYWGIY